MYFFKETLSSYDNIIHLTFILNTLSIYFDRYVYKRETIHIDQEKKVSFRRSHIKVTFIPTNENERKRTGMNENKLKWTKTDKNNCNQTKTNGNEQKRTKKTKKNEIEQKQTRTYKNNQKRAKMNENERN